MKPSEMRIEEDAVAATIEKYGRDACNLIPLLHDLQSQLGCISPEVTEMVAEQLGITVSRVHGVATFYSLFYTKPHGRHIVRLCDSPPCHIEGSKAIREAVCKELGISEGETTEDGNFSLEIVSCMGLCGVAPAMMIDDDVYGNLKPENVSEILRRYREDSHDKGKDISADGAADTTKRSVRKHAAKEAN